MRILVIGAGYVGLCTGVVLAKNHDVTLVDIDKSKINAINNKIPPIHEEQLKEYLESGVSSGRLRAMHVDDHVNKQDVVMICVGTPSDKNGTVDMTY
ncbi:MAG: 2-dehydropantoate 2-reductase N-terminal domain-containing protein, partial [Candidatus Thorarchaeota archaeon]